MLRTTILAAAAMLAVGAAQAQDYPVLNGSGDNAVVTYGDAGHPGSVVGGAAVRWSGSGNDTDFSYGETRPVAGRVARLQGSREEAEVIYAPAPIPAPRAIAGLPGTRNGG